MNEPTHISVDVTDMSAGWATVTLTAGRQRVQVRCSYVVDSLGDLINGLAGLIKRPGKFEVEFMTEDRGAYLVTIRRDGDSLEVVAKRTMSDWDETSVEIGRQSRARLRWRGRFRDGVAAFAEPFERLRQTLSPVGFKAAWWHPFPEAAIRALQAFAVEST